MALRRVQASEKIERQARGPRGAKVSDGTLVAMMMGYERARVAGEVSWRGSAPADVKNFVRAAVPGIREEGSSFMAWIAIDGPSATIRKGDPEFAMRFVLERTRGEKKGFSAEIDMVRPQRASIAW